MKLKTLLFILMAFAGIASAQDTIRSLVITEACMRNSFWGYLELTNMGDKDVQLNNFKVGKIEPWENVLWTPRSADRIFRLPERILKPGESFLIANVWDYSLELHAKGVNTPGSGSAEVIHKKDLAEMADLQVHFGEKTGEPTDSVSPYDEAMSVWWGRDCWYLQYHLPNGDSVVVDQVGGVFDSGTGLNQPFDNNWGPPSEWGYDVAGVRGATFSAHLIRKFIVKKGNLNFANARGVGNDDSEWIAIPIEGGPSFYNTGFRKALWTAGNHVNAQLNESTLESDVIKVDFAKKTLTVPWGIRRNDDIMNSFAKKPGIGWNYHRAANTSVDDSLSFAAKTGDKLELWVCGTDMQKATFDIIVEKPAANAKIAVPKLNQDPEGNWRDNLGLGMLTWPRVTQHKSGMDTIWGEWGGIPYQTRIDSLMDRLEIPSNATWKLVTVDGAKRPDVKEGDLLKIIAQDGSEKDYYISVNNYSPSHNALLSAITWPDIPQEYRDIYGWKGDTIPNFASSSFNYSILVPLDVDGIPALVAKAQDLNSKIEIVRASNLSGTPEDRTVTFTVTAEDDTTVYTYKVELIKEKNPNNIQPFHADPIISEYVHKVRWANSYTELFNPGNQPIDLSNYMLVSDFVSDPVLAVSSHVASGGFGNRYRSYIPGYRFTNEEAEWSVTPGILQPDLNVNAILMPGDVFCLGDVPNTSNPNFIDQLDIEFKKNPWGANQSGTNRNVTDNWGDGYMWLFKILNDSIKLGLKAPNDIRDFELVDTYFINRSWQRSWRRLPHIWKGNPVMSASQNKDNMANFEWEEKSSSSFNGNSNLVPSNIGLHYFIQPTHYLSTVSSVVYKVSDGYSVKEAIWGMKTGTTVADFMANLIKKNENQVLKVHSNKNGTVLSMDAVLSMSDTLVVMSADSVNITKYVLGVSEKGLSPDAVLTSNRYVVTVNKAPKSAGETAEDGTGTISGFEYGTKLNTLLANIIVPAGANLSVVNSEGAYVPLRFLNFDTSYVYTTVNANTYLDVLAEDGLTRIVYQLQPQSSQGDAFVLSNAYNVSQKELLIEFVPRGTNVQSFLSNLIPSLGATMKVVDKMGNERTNGTVADDDKLAVTSANGLKQTIYHISKLATKYVPKSTYLAYITSNTYMVDQLNYVVHNVSGTAPISEFYSNINVAPGATAVVVDKNGLVKTNGDIDGSDKVQVTSADGKIKVMYAFGKPTSNQKLDKQEISVYPNPTSGKIRVSGVQAGNRIQVFSSTGAVVRDAVVQNSMEILSLDNQPDGMYMIVVSAENSVTAKFKVIKF